MGHAPASCSKGRFCCHFGVDVMAWATHRCRRCVTQVLSCFLSFGKKADSVLLHPARTLEVASFRFGTYLFLGIPPRIIFGSLDNGLAQEDFAWMSGRALCMVH